MHKKTQSAELLLSLVNRLSPDHRQDYEERAGIMEFDGGLSRDYAEPLALLDLLSRRPMALTGITVLHIEMDGESQWLLTNDTDMAHRYVADVGGVVLGEVDLGDVLHQQYGGFALLTTLG